MPKKARGSARKKAAAQRERMQQQRAGVCSGLEEPVPCREESNSGTGGPFPSKEESSVSIDYHCSIGDLSALSGNGQGNPPWSDSPKQGVCTPPRVPLRNKSSAGQETDLSGTEKQTVEKTEIETEYFTGKQTVEKTEIETEYFTEKQTVEKTEIETDYFTEKQTEEKTEIQSEESSVGLSALSSPGQDDPPWSDLPYSGICTPSRVTLRNKFSAGQGTDSFVLQTVNYNKIRTENYNEIQTPIQNESSAELDLDLNGLHTDHFTEIQREQKAETQIDKGTEILTGFRTKKQIAKQKAEEIQTKKQDNLQSDNEDKMETEKIDKTHTKQDGNQSEKQDKTLSKNLDKLQTAKQDKRQTMKQKNNQHKMKNGTKDTIQNEKYDKIQTEKQDSVQNTTKNIIQIKKLGKIQTERQNEIHIKKQNMIQTEKLNTLQTEKQIKMSESFVSRKGNATITGQLINNNCVYSVQGHFHQGSECFPSTNAGKQCVANCLSSILYSKNKTLESWNAQDLDNVLIAGDDLYSSLQRCAHIIHDYLLITDLPRAVEIHGTVHNVDLEEPIVGLMSPDLLPKDSKHSTTFSNAVAKAFEISNACFVTFCGNTIALMKGNQSIFLFDSHSRNHFGIVSSEGKSVLLCFKTVGDVVKHCYFIANQLSRDTHIQFEITPLIKDTCLSSKRIAKAVIAEVSYSVNQTETTAAAENESITISHVDTEEIFTFIPLTSSEKLQVCNMCNMQYIGNRKISNISKPLKAPSKVRPISKDGNCFFRAVSWSLSNSENSHKDLRDMTVDHMLRKAHHFRSYLPENFSHISDYVLHTNMLLSKTWATEVEIKAMADMLGMNIFVFSGGKWLKTTPFGSFMYTGSMYLVHTHNNHYDVVLDTEHALERNTIPDNRVRVETVRANKMIQAYFHDQASKILIHEIKPQQSTDGKKKSRLEYMKAYMKKARETNADKYRSIDLTSKKKARETNPTKIQSTERATKRKVRATNPNKYRSIDLTSKKKARKTNPDKYHSIDLISKKKAIKTNQDKYRSVNLIIKKKARKTNPDKCRSIDLISKKKARKTNPDKCHSIDLISKKKARKTNPDKCHSIDLISKQKARKTNPDKCHSIDLISKKKARKTNPDKYHSIDLISKKKARETNPTKIRSMERATKKKVRESNPDKYYSIDRNSKKKFRLDPVLLQKRSSQDVERKRQSRLNQSFLEIERIKQCERRKINRGTVLMTDRKRKSDMRSDPENSKMENKHRKHGSSIDNCILKFEENIKYGTAYVCTCCHQTWCKESVTQCNLETKDTIFNTEYKSVDDLVWICKTCTNSLSKGKVPKLSVANGMIWPKKPPELDLHPLEERLVALRIPFIQIRELPKGGQYSAKGNVVNVPVEIQPTVNALPRQMDEDLTIAVKFKRKLSYQSCVFSENVRPASVLAALHWLMDNSKLYKNANISVDNNWLKETTDSANDQVQEFLAHQKSSTDNGHSGANGHIYDTNSDDLDTEQDQNNADETQDEDKFIEVYEESAVEGNSDTLIDDSDLDTNKALVFAPGEGQRPLSLYHDKDAEVLSFPTIFCGQQRVDNQQRKVRVSYSDIAKWELRSVDRRAANSVPNIFLKLNIIQRKQVADKVNLAVRRKKNEGKKITAEQARNPAVAERIVNLNEGYYIFRTLRNSPAYLSSRKKDIFAMIRQIGLPTWFMSLSSADTRWEDLLKCLAELAGKKVSSQDIKDMTWAEKSKLVQKDPVTCSRFFDNRVKVFMNTVLKSDHSPIGTVTDSFKRVEFQNRGSPHVHMIIWTNDAPKYKIDSIDDIVKYVDTYTTCSLDGADNELKQLVLMQVHKHSKTCKKGGKSVCRFGFPLPPLSLTMLLEPLDTDVEEYSKKYKELHSRMNEFKDGCDMSYEQFLKDVAQMDECEYIKCIRSTLRGPKIFLKRKPTEMRVNYYNETVLRAWKANLDLQFVLDPYACAMYIVSYISKSQRGMSTMLDQAAKEAAHQNLDLKRQVRHIGNQFLNFIEISAQEAAYLVLQMPLTRASRDVVFINTSTPDQRVFLLKTQDELEKLSPNSTNIEADNVMKRYSKRPKQLNHYCLADYVAELEVKYPKKEKDHSDKRSTNVEDREHNDDDDVFNEVNDDDDEVESNDRQTILKLRNGITFKKREKPKIIRYVSYNKDTNTEHYCREKLLLFMPWRNEEKDLLGGYSSFNEHFKSKLDQLLPVIQKYEHNVDELDLARCRAEEDHADQYNTLAPNTEQMQAEDMNELPCVAEDFIHYIPQTQEQSNVDIGQDFGVVVPSAAVETRSVILPEEEYLSLLKCLNQKQREFFNHVVHWVTTKNEPIYAFLSGGAGVGKSVLIRALYQALHKLLNSRAGDDPDSIKILLTAFTGKAAYNINGSTIDSAFHKKMFQKEQHMHSDELNTFRTTFKNLTVVIIDEISMIGNKKLAFIHQRLTELTGRKQDFGGISIIAVGDLYQLSPVGESWIFEDLRISLAKNLWKEHFQMYELEEIMRQKDDLEFSELLNRLRINKLTKSDLAVLQSHITDTKASDYPNKALHLFTENKRVDAFNTLLIEKLDSVKADIKADTSVISPANISQDSKANLIKEMDKKMKHSDTGNLPTILKAAVGMTYDFTINVSVEDGLTNGATGVLKYIEYKETSNARPAILWIYFSDEQIGKKRRSVFRHLYHTSIDRSWTPIFEEKRTFLFNRKTYERVQFPLIPSAAKTVHKAQGATVDELVVDLSSSFGAPHIHYVALSRVRKLQNLHILNLNEKALKVDQKVNTEMERLRETPMKLCYRPLYDIDDSYVKIVFHNTRSLHKHIEDVRQEPNICNADVIGLCESRLNPSESSDSYDLPGFTLYRADQQGSSDKRPIYGIAVFVQNSCIVNEVSKYSENGMEFIYLNLTIKRNESQVVFLYKKPKLTTERLKSVLEVVKTLVSCDKPVFILGDFNINNDQSANLGNFMQRTFGCQQLISKPTTVYKTTIDHIYTNTCNVVSDVIPAYWSDHDIIYCAKTCHPELFR